MLGTVEGSEGGEKGLSRVELFERIRIDRREEGLSVRALARRHHVHRRTVHQALLVTPAYRGWRAGLERSQVAVDGDGAVTALAGAIGDLPQPPVRMVADDTTTLLHAEKSFGRGGLHAAIGPRRMKTYLALHDTHTQQAQVRVDGHHYRYGGWITEGTTTVGLLLTNEHAEAVGPLYYDGAENGHLAGRHHQGSP